MELFLCIAAFWAFWASGPSGALLLRCGLDACLRFSPRSAIALSSLCALCAAAASLPLRGGLRAVHGPPDRLVTAGFVGGVLGRALLLMACARFPGSLALRRIQALPLLLLVLLPAKRHPPRPARAPVLAALLCAAAGGFFGAGDALLLSRLLPGGIERRRGLSSDALLVRLCAQAGALLLTLLSGAAQVFPPRMLAEAAVGAAAGALFGEYGKKRGALPSGMRAAARVYEISAALACAEQAL